MTEEVKRNYLEINSLQDLIEGNKPSEDYSLSLIDRKKTNRDIYSSRNQLIQAMTFERSESIFGAPPEGEKKNKVSEQAYYTAKSMSDYFVGQNCPQ